MKAPTSAVVLNADDETSGATSNENKGTKDIIKSPPADDERVAGIPYFEKKFLPFRNGVFVAGVLPVLG